MGVQFLRKNTSENDICHTILNNNNDVNSMDGINIMDSTNSVDSAEEAVVIDLDDDEIVDIPSDGLIIRLTFKIDKIQLFGQL